MQSEIGPNKEIKPAEKRVFGKDITNTYVPNDKKDKLQC